MVCLACHADGVDGWWTNMLGVGFRVISPARFGYFGLTFRPTATPVDQADAYTLLLDHLGIDRVAILGYSAGSASVLEFARRHPDRAIVLILASARLGGSTPSRLLKPILGPCTATTGCSGSTGRSCRLSTVVWSAPQGLPANP